MEYNFNNKRVEPCLYSLNSIIINANKGFTDFTGFTLDELLGKSLVEIGYMLRINMEIIFDSVDSKYCGYIFTKCFKAREVYISLFVVKETNEKLYTFFEKPKSRLDDKLIFVKQMFNDNISGAAIYSVPDLILLKANQKYFDFNDPPFNKEEISIGKPIREIITGFIGSRSEVIFNTVLRTQEASYTKELKMDCTEFGITYWDVTQTPIFENGKMKYIFNNAIEVTERVLKNQSLDQQNNIIKQQKKQLEQQNAELNSIIENLSEGVLIADKENNFIMANSRARELIYQSDKVIDVDYELQSTKLFDMKGNKIPFENYPIIRALRGEKVQNAKVFVSHPKKEYYAEISSIPIYNANGNLTMVISCFHDISETIEQSRKIEEQKRQLEAIIENIADGISVFNNKGEYILFNTSEREIFYPFNEHLSNTNDWYEQSELYDIDGEKISLENIPSRRIMRGEKFTNMTMSVRLPQKTLQICVSGTPIYNSKGEFILGVLCSRNMTEYFNHEQDIRSRYEFMNRMIETLDLSVVRLSYPDLKIMDINKQAFKMIKSLSPNITSIKQIKDNRIEGLYKIVKPSEYYQCINEVLKEKETKYLNKQRHLVNGNEIYWNIIFEPILDVNGEIQKILIITVDVTPEIKSNLAMEKTLKSQEEYFVNISHELKTPLNIISSTVQLFNMHFTSGSLDERRNSIIKYMDSIKRNSYRISKLINNIVDLSKIEAGFFELHLSNNNIVEVVEEIVMSITNLSESKDLNIIFDTNIEEKIIACDVEKIERVVLNLISNAIKFSNEGSEIFVEFKDKNEFVEISVKDNGIGIKSNDLSIIFDRFKQVDNSLSKNAEGTGIGLSLVKSIAELHGGSIHVESEFGKGSRFTIILPSLKVAYENILYNSKMVNKNKTIEIELSDIFS